MPVRFPAVTAAMLLLVPAPLVSAQESRVLDAVRDEQDGVRLALPTNSSSNAAPSIGGDRLTDGALFGDDRYGQGLSAEQERGIVDKAYPLLAAKWPFNEIFVCWESMDQRYARQRALVREAILGTWERQSGLEFFGWGACSEASAGIRIAVKDTGPHVKYLGKFVSGVKDGMVLNFTYNNWSTTCRETLDYCNRVIAVHEFGHAIGFAHEQNRPDTEGECAELEQGTDGDTIDLTPWDPHSVMNYCNPTYSNDGVLSEFDVKAVQYIYGRP